MVIVIDADDALSFEMCKEYALQFDRLYKAKGSLYPHPNPMKRSNAIDISPRDPSGDDNPLSLVEFFNSIQFPINYNFGSDSTGVVNRGFTEPAFQCRASFHGVDIGNPDQKGSSTIDASGEIEIRGSGSGKFNMYYHLGSSFIALTSQSLHY